MIKSDGGEATYINVDTSKIDSVERMVSNSVEKYGDINILVNNAAAFVFGNIEHVTQDDWGKVLGVNVIGYANCVQKSLESLKKNSDSSIINIASVSSFIAQPDFVPYNTSKGAVIQLSKCLAMDLSKYNIRVNSICPGSIRTRASDQHIKSLGLDPEKAYEDFANDSMLKRNGKPIEIAYGALFLASKESSFMTCSQIVIDGGATID